MSKFRTALCDSGTARWLGVGVGVGMGDRGTQMRAKCHCHCGFGFSLLFVCSFIRTVSSHCWIGDDKREKKEVGGVDTLVRTV